MFRTSLFCTLIFVISQKGFAQNNDFCFSSQYSSDQGIVHVSFATSINIAITSDAFLSLICLRYSVLNSNEKTIEKYFYYKEVDNKIYLGKHIDSISFDEEAGIFGTDGSLTITDEKYILYKPTSGDLKLVNCYSHANVENSDIVIPVDSPLVENVDTSNDLADPIEVEPYFPGGNDSLMLYLKTNLVYPQISKEIGAEGTVYIQFIVEKDGSISEILILRGVEDHINKEAIRLIESMPNWIPGYLNGEAVRVRFVLPLNFKLN